MKASSHASVVCLAFSVLDNHSPRAVPHWYIMKCSWCPLCHQCTREVVQGVTNASNAFAWCAGVRSLRALVALQGFHFPWITLSLAIW